MRAILQALADGTGPPMPRLRVPSGLIPAAAASSTLVRRNGYVTARRHAAITWRD
jgi:hypothetical protein